MIKKNALWIIPIILLATALIIPSTVKAQGIAVLSVSPLVIDITRPGGALNPGSTFTINLTAANIPKLWGYQYEIQYNTTILTATDYHTFAPFTRPAPSQINDTTGTVGVSYTSYPGDPTGLTISATSPATISSVDFTVDGMGTTTLFLNQTWSKLVDTTGHGYQMTLDNLALVSGYFSNTEEIKLHDVAITDMTVSATTVKPGDTIDVTVKVTNEGVYNETFKVAIDYNDNPIGSNQTVTDLEPDQTTTLNFQWATRSILSEGDYVLNARIFSTTDQNPGNNAKSKTITLSLATGGGQLLSNFIYIAAGIVIIVVVIVIIYVLMRRRRK